MVLDEQLDALATAMRSATEAADDFARTALVTAGRNNIAPVSHFTTARKSGSFTTFRFTDTSTAGDLDPLTIEWDFGDGTTASSAAGELVEHTFAVPGSYSVNEFVSDGLASSSAQRTVTAGSAAPTALTEDATNVSTKQATLHATIDANGNPVTLRFQLGPTIAYGADGGPRWPDPRLRAADALRRDAGDPDPRDDLPRPRSRARRVR